MTVAPPDSICLSGLSVYLPADVVTADAVAKASGLPADVVADKLGLRQKHVAGDDEHVSSLTVAAARPLVAARKSSAAGSAALIYFGSSIKDYDLWSCAVSVQHDLELADTYSFEVASNCAGFGVALHVGRALLLADPDLQSVWLVGASKEASVVDYSDVATKSVFAFGDGAAAAVLERGDQGLEVLATAIVSDGTFNRAVLIPAGGTRQPASADTVQQELHKVRVQEDLHLGKTVGPQFMEHMVTAGRRAIRQAGIEPEDLDLVVLQHQIPSVVRAILDDIGAKNADTVDLGDYGHMSSVDVPMGLHRAVTEQRLPDGGHALFLSAGLGYTWSAAVVRARSPLQLLGES
jgi:3-oxoacyl-[acyl-carrier-protein] synthase-3